MTKSQAEHPGLGQLDALDGWCLSGRLNEDGESRTIPLTPLPFRIGRRSGLSLTLSHQTVSGLHAEIDFRDQQLFVRDLHSTNGTFINGAQLFGEQEIFENDLIQFADVAFRVARHLPDTKSHTRCANASDQAMALVQFDRLVEHGALTPFFQPIVDLTTHQAVAFEALARSRYVGLETAEFMFAAAAQLGRVNELTQLMRSKAVETSGLFPTPPHLFLNTHPSEGATSAFLESCVRLRKLAPLQRITIELHEAAMTQVGEMAALRHGLEAIDITLAFDDFGIGQHRLAELSEVKPHYLKFDRSLVRRLNTADVSRTRIVRGLVATVYDIGIIPLAEGIETEAEAAACVDLGFVLAQGYYYGKPMPVSHYTTGDGT
jgi:EAL domain-containing protein (putative c-di-GMP-specific phosphodiesterase class I)